MKNAQGLIMLCASLTFFPVNIEESPPGKQCQSLFALLHASKGEVILNGKT